MITVVNKYKHTPTSHDIYIGRGSVLGNPYTHLPNSKTPHHLVCGTREESIDKYKIWLKGKLVKKDMKIKNELWKIIQASRKGVVFLVCYCAPKPCHGIVIQNYCEYMITKIEKIEKMERDNKRKEMVENYALSLIKHEICKDIDEARIESKRWYDKSDTGLVEPLKCPHRPDVEITTETKNGKIISETHITPNKK